MTNEISISHQCTMNSPFDTYGPAITDTYELSNGTLWAGNGEYESQVNFCPRCGYAAKVKIA